VAFDAQLYREEIRVQVAWARELCRLGVLSKAEMSRAEELLQEAKAAIAAGTFPWQIQDEDIHMNLERYLTERAGDLGKKIHLGRSRNDLIATTLRLKVSAMTDELGGSLKPMIAKLVAFCQQHLSVLIPGLTHMQHGQPVRLAHALSAHGWAFHRDLGRLQQVAASAMRVMPLGSGALSGTPLAIDEHQLCESLGFALASANSYDSVSDRDFLLEYLQAVELLSVHVQRLCEDLIFYSSGAVGVIKLPRAWSTGSSMMPNKRNPDVLELSRGRVSRIIGLCQSGSHLIKSVSLSYGSELHELKKTLLMVHGEIHEVVSILPCFMAEMGLDEERAQLLLQRGHILATEVADFLTSSAGLPFRDSYRMVAQLVELADKRGVQIHQLALEQLSEDIRRHLPADYWSQLSFEFAVERRQGLAGTGRAAVGRALEQLLTTLD
jgi:argininosuccinate lyase